MTEISTLNPFVAKDFLKLIVGLLVSVAIVLAIHYGQDAGSMEDEAPSYTSEMVAISSSELT